jgi:isopropylmalate/homocitrate/citramalate synthase
MMEHKVYIIDVTNRDGVQASGMALPMLAKTLLNLRLDRMGIFQSELGFPTLRHEVNYINANLALARAGEIRRLRLQGWCRGVPEDITLALKNCPGLEHLNISLPTSDTMISAKFGGRKTRQDMLTLVASSTALAKERGISTLGIGAEDASRTGLDDLIAFALAGKKAGADRFRYSDTLGADDPLTIYERIKSLAEAIDLPIELHCHNDLGLAVAASLAGAQGAIAGKCDAYINTTINGCGERAGNCDLVSLLLAVRYAPGLKGSLSLGGQVDLTQAGKLAEYAAHAFQRPIPVNQPGVGANAFAHASGIHTDGMLKDRHCYELYGPEDVGRGAAGATETGRTITVGAYGGMHGFRHVCDKLGIQFRGEQEARRALELVQYAHLHTQKPLGEEELRLIANYPDLVATILTATP